MATDPEAGQPWRATEMHSPVQKKNHQKMNCNEKERTGSALKEETSSRQETGNQRKKEEEKVILKDVRLLRRGSLVQKLLNIFAHYCSHMQEQGKTPIPINRSCTWDTSSTSRKEASLPSAVSKTSENKQCETTIAGLYFLQGTQMVSNVLQMSIFFLIHWNQQDGDLSDGRMD